MVFFSFPFPFYSCSIWFSHVWGKHWLSAQGAALQGTVGNAPYGAGETSVSLWRCSSAPRALGAFHTCAKEKWIWHKDFPGALMYEKQNEFARGDCKKISALPCAKPASLMELCCPYLLPFLLNCSVSFLLPSCSAENKSRGEQRWLILQLVERLIKCAWCWHSFTAAWTRGWQIAGGVWAASSPRLTQLTGHRVWRMSPLGNNSAPTGRVILTHRDFLHKEAQHLCYSDNTFVAFSQLFRGLIGLPTSASFSFGLVTKTFCLQWSCCCAVAMVWISTWVEADAHFEHNLSWFATQLCVQNHWTIKQPDTAGTGNAKDDLTFNALHRDFWDWAQLAAL